MELARSLTLKSWKRKWVKFHLSSFSIIWLWCFPTPIWWAIAHVQRMMLRQWLFLEPPSNFNHSGSGMKSHCCRMCTDFLYTFDYVEQILESTGDQQGLTKRNQISNVELGSVAVVAFGSRAHLEKQALATVSSKSSVNVSIRRYTIRQSNQPWVTLTLL